MKKAFILIMLVITFAACSSSEENSVAPSKEQSKFTTLSSNGVPDFDHVKGILLADDYVEVSRPDSFVDPQGFLNYKKLEFFSKPSVSPDVWALYGWDESNLPGTPDNPPVPAECNKKYSEEPQPNGYIFIYCVGDGNTCGTEAHYNNEGKLLRVTITRCITV